jgi:hypothetical protein
MARVGRLRTIRPERSLTMFAIVRSQTARQAAALAKDTIEM